MITIAFIFLGVFYLYAFIKSLTSDAFSAANGFWFFVSGVTGIMMIALVASTQI